MFLLNYKNRSFTYKMIRSFLQMQIKNKVRSNIYVKPFYHPQEKAV